MITNETMAKIAVNKSLLKEYDTNDGRTVYLNNGDEFQIQLFNPNTEPIAASISINNEELSNKIIIRPGERIWLERYLDRAKKFRFETYEVEDNVTTEKAIAHNGEVVIRFYEKSKYSISDTYISAINTGLDWYTSDNNLNKYDYNKYVNDLSSLCTNKVYSDNNLINTNSTKLTSLTVGDDSLHISSTALKGLVLDGTDEIATTALSTSSNNIETGRISEGSYSNQKFNNVNEYYNTWAFKIETIKILPQSRKPYTSNDLEKIYCTECGRKLKTKFKYCPFCGTKIDY